MTLVIIIDLLVVVSLTGIAILKGFEHALPLAAFLLIIFPVESQIPLPGLFDLTTQRLVLITLSALFIVLGRRHRSRAARQVPMKYMLLFLIVWMLVSSANSVVFSISLKSVLSQFFDFFLPYYIFAKSITKVRTVHRIILAFIAAMFVCSCLGVVETYKDWSILSVFPPTPHRFGGGVFEGAPTGDRTQSTFGHPILFGAGLAMAIPLAVYMISITRETLSRMFLWISVALMLLCIYKTASRGPWIALTVSFGVLMLLGGSRIRRYLIVLALLAASVLVLRPGIWMTLKNIQVATKDPESPRGMSYQWRYALYRIAFNQINRSAKRALWGYGPESFYYLNIEDEFMGHIVKYESCDSSVAQLLIETGYVGFLIASGLLLQAAFLTRRSFGKLAPPDKYLSLVFLTNIVTFSFLMTNVAIWSWGQQSTMFWILLALSVCYPRLVRARDSALRSKSGQTVQNAHISRIPSKPADIRPGIVVHYGSLRPSAL